jgi:hypothetical protein
LHSNHYREGENAAKHLALPLYVLDRKKIHLNVDELLKIITLNSSYLHFTHTKSRFTLRKGVKKHLSRVLRDALSPKEQPDEPSYIAYHSRFIPERIGEASPIFPQNIYILPKLSPADRW